MFVVELKMKITRLVVDGRPLEGKLTGVGYYIFEMINIWQRLDLDLDVTVIMRKKPEIKLPGNVKLVVERSNLFARLKPVVWQRYFSMRLISECDWYWGTAVFLPLRLERNTKTLVSVYDFNHLVVPQTMPWGNRLAHRAWMKKDLMRATRLITISDGTADRIVEFTGRERPIIINPTVRPSIKRACAEEQLRILSDLGIRPPFFLAVGTFEPRKNLDLLVEAFVQLKKEFRIPEFSLILVGNSGWKNSNLLELIRSSSHFGVRSLGYVPDEILSALYSACWRFVFPSIYEGFGMPVMEATACGALIITTDIVELREAADHAGIFIKPNIGSIKEALLLSSEECRHMAADNSPVRDKFRTQLEKMIALMVAN